MLATAGTAMGCLSGAKMATSSLFASHYATYVDANSVDVGVLANLLLFGSAAVGGGLASSWVRSVVSGRYHQRSRFCRSSVMTLASGGVLVLLGCILTPLVVVWAPLKAAAWIGLCLFGTFNGFAGVLVHEACSFTQSLNSLQVAVVQVCALVGGYIFAY